MSKPAPPHLPEPGAHYRPDIDGLRALAVIAVCGYHAGVPWLGGGFIGVDVFLVISGYLMAALIGRELVTGNFSLAAFYERRARRLLPALLVVLLVTIATSCLVLGPRLLAATAETAVATLLLASNVDFAWHSSSYFDVPSASNPLLHTWSLSLEEQFYVVFPVALLWLWRWRGRAVVAALAGVTILSLAACAWGAMHAPTATFYLLPTRAWELLLGALAAFVGGSRLGLIASLARAGSPVAIGAIAVGMVAFGAETPFPGLSALVPSLATAVLLIGGVRRSALVSRLLSAAPWPAIGRISYSLYLWHWPMLVLAAHLGVAGRDDYGRRAMVVAVSGVVAYASWRWIEQPLRRRAWLARPSAFAGACAASMLLVAALGIAVISSGGWPSRVAAAGHAALDRQWAAELQLPAWQGIGAHRCFVRRASEWDGERCFITSGAGPKALLWGDSFASSLAYGFVALQPHSLSVLQYTAGACPPVLDYDAVSNRPCAPFNRAVLELIAAHKISVVVMAANWDSYLRRGKLTVADISATTDRLREQGVRVIVVGQSPLFAFDDPADYLAATRADGGQLRARSVAKADINARLRALLGADAVFDPEAVLCDAQGCIFKEADAYLVRDHGHVTGAGSMKLTRELLKVLDR